MTKPNSVRAKLLFGVVGQLVLATACKTTAPGEETNLKAAASTAVPAASDFDCIKPQPLREDGYDGFAIVSDNQVKRRIFRGGRIIDDPEKTLLPSPKEVRDTMNNIGNYVNWINSTYRAGSPNRRVETYRKQAPGTKPSEPYCLFHSKDRRIFGTVILFSGFNDRPQQQAALGAYLFNSGFNVYNVYLAHHFKVPGTDFWPRTTYRPEIAQLILKKLSNPANAPLVQIIKQAMGKGDFTDSDLKATDRLLGPELSSEMLNKAWEDPGGPNFRKYYVMKDRDDAEVQPSDFMDYLRDAKARLNDLKPMPGPIFLSGLSVGGSLVMALAAADGGERIHGVVTSAPWLLSANKSDRMQSMFAGPLGENIKLIGGPFPIKFENQQIDFSPASASANAALGAWVTRPEQKNRLRAIPHAVITTEIDNSADNGTIRSTFDYMNSGPYATLHYWEQYPASYNIGHAFTDPENYRSDNVSAADGGGWNRHWRTLYQETFRFFITGTINNAQFLSKTQDRSLPEVRCKITGDFAKRCDQ